MLMSLSAALYLLASFYEQSMSSAALPKIESPSLLLAGAPALQTPYRLLQCRPSALPLVCPNPPTRLQDCVRQTYKTNLFKVEILLIRIAYYTKRITCFFILFHIVKTKRLRLRYYIVLLSQQFCYCTYRPAFV